MVEVTVVEVRRETPDAVTLRLDLGGAAFPYRPGQYIEMDPHQFAELAGPLAALEAAKGMPESPRAFSLSSDGSDPRFLEISVKEEKAGKFPPVLSPWIVRELRPGRKVLLSGPQGRYVLPEPIPEGSGYLHLCAGSGVAPNRGMIRSALARGGTDRHLLVLQNRTEADVFYRQEWPALAQRYRERFKVRHAYSGDAPEPVTISLLRQELAGFLEGSTATALVCGPNRPRDVVLSDGSKRRQPGFCEVWGGNPRRKVGGRLEQLGFTPDRILMEMW